MSKSRMIHGSPLLIGDNKVPGLKLPEELEVLLPTIFQSVRDYGCDFYPTVVQMLTYDEMAEICSYGGFPVRFPHWKWGMEYEEFQRGYEHGMMRVYEIVINSNPCYIYCLDSNTLVDNVTVVAHALGHNDFFKNNIYFQPTNQNMMNRLANHGTRIRKYMKRWGKERVIEFIDYVLRIETLMDTAKAWNTKKVKNPIIKDERKYKHAKRIPVRDDKDFMHDYVNPKEWRDKEDEKMERKEVADELGIFQDSTKDIMGFIRDYAPLKPWQADIVAMIYEEAMYFAPQRTTKMLNEGWASKTDYEIMCNQGLVGLGQESHDCGIIEYAKHKMGVLGGKYSMNPYKLGFCLFQDIEERWNKGKFGDEYDNCTNLKEKEDWDKNLGLGKEKTFEVRKHYDDITALIEFFTEDFCNENEFFDWKKYPNGEVVLESRDYKVIKKKLIKKYLNGGLPEIYLEDPNFRNKSHMLLQHKWDGRPLHVPYVAATLSSLQYLWGNNVFLATRDKNSQEIVYCAYSKNEEDVIRLTRDEFEAVNH